MNHSFSFSIEKDDIVTTNDRPIASQWGDPFPNYNIEETNQFYAYYLDVPGVNSNDMKIALTGNTINISGERKYIINDESSKYIYSESKYNSFSRDIKIMNDCDIDSCKASLNNGVLKLKIFKKND